MKIVSNFSLGDSLASSGSTFVNTSSLQVDKLIQYYTNGEHDLTEKIADAKFPNGFLVSKTIKL